MLTKFKSVPTLMMLHAMQSLARMGARVTGIDLSSASVDLARQHAQQDPQIAQNVTYQAISTDRLAEQGRTLQGLDVFRPLGVPETGQSDNEAVLVMKDDRLSGKHLSVTLSPSKIGHGC